MGWISSKGSNGYGFRGRHRSFCALVVNAGGCWERESDPQGAGELGVWPVHPCSLLGLLGFQGSLGPWRGFGGCAQNSRSRNRRPPGDRLDLGPRVGQLLPEAMVFCLEPLELPLCPQNSLLALLPSGLHQEELPLMQGGDLLPFSMQVLGHGPVEA